MSWISPVNLHWAKGRADEKKKAQTIFSLDKDGECEGIIMTMGLL